MTVKENVAILKSYIRKAPNDNKERIAQIVNFYSHRKIRNIKTAQSMVDALAGEKYRRSPTAVISRYEVFVAKHGGAAEEAQALGEPPTSSQAASEKPRPTPPACLDAFASLYADAMKKRR